VSGIRGTPIDFELANLKMNLGLPSDKIGEETIPEHIYMKMVYDSMQRAKLRLNNLVATDSYKRMNNEKKQNAIKKIVNDERDKERNRIKFQLRFKGGI
jgi:hypothetical protein